MEKMNMFKSVWLWLGLSIVSVGLLIGCLCEEEKRESKAELLIQAPVAPWQDSVKWKSIDNSGMFTERAFDTRNKSEGKNEVKGVILHHTACATAKEAFDTLTVGKGKVSCHVLIDEDGSRYVLASPETITHHAGLSRLNGKDGANNFTIGIEFQGNTLEQPLTDKQIESAIEYLEPLLKRYKIPVKNIVTHEFIRSEWKKAHPKRTSVPDKQDLTPDEYTHFMTALNDSLALRK